MSDDYRIDSINKDIDSLKLEVSVLRREIAALELRQALLQAKTDSIVTRVTTIDNGFTWVWRTVGGIVITALMAYVISGGISVPLPGG